MAVSALSYWSEKVIRTSFYLLFILVPLILTPWNYELFEYNKMMITYALAAVIGGAWVVKMISEKELKIAKTPLDIPILLFVASQFISSLFSMDPHVSWLGYYSRFNGGMWSIFTYTLLYYAFVTNFLPSDSSSHTEELKQSAKKYQKHAVASEAHEPKDVSTILRLFTVAISTGVVVALYGVLEHFGIDKNLWVQDVQTRVFSTLGQPNWLAAYLVALLPLTWGFALCALRSDKNQAMRLSLPVIVWTAISVLFFITLLYSRSRSGLFALAVVDLLFWGMLFVTRSRERSVTISAGILHAIFALIVFFNGSNVAQIDRHFTLEGIKNQYKKATVQTQQAPSKPTGPALETGGTESGTIRKYVWEGALLAWKSTTKTWLIGTGTETFAFAFYQFRPVGHNNTSEWDFLYNKAHNEYLNYLATTGVFGLGTYILFIGAFAWWFLKNMYGSWFMVHRKTANTSASTTMTTELSTISVALFTGWLSILVTNFFGFSVVIVQLFLFLFPACIVLLESVSDPSYIRMHVSFPRWATWAVSLMAATIVLRIGLFWYADALYASAYHDARSGQYAQGKTSLELAITLNPNEPNYHDELATTLAALAVGSYEQKLATQASELARASLEQNAIALTISPQNVNYWKSKTKIYYSFSTLNPAFITEAVNALSKAAELSPNDPKIDYNLAILYGRQGQSEKAVSLLDQAIAKKKNYRDPYYALYVFYTELKQPDNAKQILNTYLQTIDASDAQFMELLKQ